MHVIYYNEKVKKLVLPAQVKSFSKIYFYYKAKIFLGFLFTAVELCLFPCNTNINVLCLCAIQVTDNTLVQLSIHCPRLQALVSV